MELKGKVALVTGAGQSTGMAIAQGLLRAGGATVIATDLEAPAWEAKVGADRLIREALDVSQEDQVIGLVKR